MEEEKKEKSLKDQAKELWGKLATFLHKTKNGDIREFTLGINRTTYIVTILLMLLAMGACGYEAYNVWLKNEELIGKTWNLKELNQYNLSSFNQSEAMNEDRDHLPSTIQEMLDLYNASKAEKERLEGEINFKTSVYTEFLRNFLLPSINIWKDPYTKEIDLSVLGRKYLDQNPYQDITLLSQWSAIIKESGKDVGINDVEEIRISGIIEDNKGYFKIPISVSFTSNSKRAFLLLVDKLSLTSNTNNLGLLNDFSYYLFNVIRDQKADEVEQLIKEYGMEKPADQDEKYFNNVVISRYLYNWIFDSDTAPSLLIDDKVIDTTIKQSVICGNEESSEVCYFRFRDKYRNIPELAYAIGLESLVNKPLALKRFYEDLPPLISIESFSFSKSDANSLSLSNSNQYRGNVNFNIYGRGMSQEEIDEITKGLAEACFGSGTNNPLDLDNTIEPVQTAIEQIGELGQSYNVEKMANLIELREILRGDKSSYGGLSPYNLMIRKFEYYRMLKNIGLCK